MVLGANGMVGRSVQHVFEESGYKVKGITREQVDLEQNAKVLELFEQLKPKIVICAAARVGGIGANSQFPVQFLESNLKIQINCMEASYKAGVEKFVFLGSSCIYPKFAAQPIHENSLLTGTLEESNSAYAIAKIAGLEQIRAYRRQYGVSWISLMPTNLYGPFDNFSLEGSHVIPSMIRKFVNAVDSGDEKVDLWGSGNPQREFLYVEDLAKGILVATEKYNDDLHLNIGSGEEMSVKELALIIASQVGYQGDIVWDTNRPEGTPRKILDSTRMRQLGWTPQVSITEGLARTITWFRQFKNWQKVRL